MMKSPDAFQSHIALSPSLGRNDEQQVKNAALFFKQESTSPKILYLGIGNEGGYTHLSTEKFADIVHENLPERMIFKYESLEEENHASMTISGFPNINWSLKNDSVQKFLALLNGAVTQWRPQKATTFPWLFSN